MSEAASDADKLKTTETVSFKRNIGVQIVRKRDSADVREREMKEGKYLARWREKEIAWERGKESKRAEKRERVRE